MDSQNPGLSSFWGISQSTSFSQLSDDDFMAMLQKQFLPQRDPIPNITAGSFSNGVDPQSISRHSLPVLTPPSEDSSPSPPLDGSNHDPNGEDSGDGEGNNISNVPSLNYALKRKASGADMVQYGPSQKSQHTLFNDEKGAPTSGISSRRKSTGNAAKDETRLLKRKEQNRAAQRAFRERKEKHVKDLEDKVAELEAKNEAAMNENENLRDLLGRLQSENVMLKQTSFTFTSSKFQPESSAAVSRHFSPESPIYSTSPTSSIISPETRHVTPKPTNPLDWTSLTSFDPNMLNLLDENPHPTATTNAMNLDIFGSNLGVEGESPFTMIASNPTFMSFVSNFDSMATPVDTQPSSTNGNSMPTGRPFSFDMNSMPPWPLPTPLTQDPSLDDLFAGYLNPNQSTDLSFTPASISPVAHQATVNTPNLAHLKDNHLSSLPQQKRSSNTGLASSESSSTSPTATSSKPFYTHKESPASGSPSADINDPSIEVAHDKTRCPRTKSELVQKIADAGLSPFAPAKVQKMEQDMGMMVSCAGSKFPRTEKNERNVEVLSAWRTITSNPKVKEANIDINNLCSEFTSKAKCDGTKVVLEPEEMHNIIESLSNKTQ